MQVRLSNHQRAQPMLLKSCQPGRYATYQQNETVWKLHAGFSNVFMASVLGQDSLRLMGGARLSNIFVTAPQTPFGLSVFQKGA